MRTFQFVMKGQEFVLLQTLRIYTLNPKMGVSTWSETLRPIYGSEMWDRADYVRPVRLGPLQSDNAHTFLIVVGEGLHDPHCGETSLQYLQDAGALDLETHVLCR